MERVMALALRLRRRAATVAIVLMAVCIGYYVVAGQNGLKSYEQKRHEAEHLQRQIENLQQENSQLQQQVHALQSDPDAIEHEARERLHYARPGEVIYTLNNAAAGANGSNPSTQLAPSSSSR
jgi:cell division protein FtsB